MPEYMEVLPHRSLMDGIAETAGVPVEALRLLLTILAGELAVGLGSSSIPLEVLVVSHMDRVIE